LAKARWQKRKLDVSNTLFALEVAGCGPENFENAIRATYRKTPVLEGNKGS
jgi:hypothetical protein